MHSNSVEGLSAPDSQALQNAIETVVGELAVGDFTIQYHETNNRDRYLTIATSEQIPGVERSPVEKYDLTAEGIVPRGVPITEP